MRVRMSMRARVWRQAHFTAAVFKQTQDEYRAEGIDVAVVGFRDNEAQV